MGKKVDDKDTVSFREFMMSNAIQIDPVVQLLIEKGIFTQKEFFARLKQVQAEYERKVSIQQ